MNEAGYLLAELRVVSAAAASHLAQHGCDVVWHVVGHHTGAHDDPLSVQVLQGPSQMHYIMDL